MSMGPMRVFVSASALDAETRSDVLRHLAPLSVELCPAAALARADVALVLVSGNYLADDLLRSELARILDERARRGLRVIPVLVSSSLWESVEGLKELKPLPLDRVPLSAQRDREAALVTIAQALGATPRATESAGGTTAPDVSRRHLPAGGAHLFGREPQIAQLDEAWASHGRIRVVSIVAMGGAGKSTLVVHWLNRLAEDGYRGARRVLGYSFYRQGTSDAAADTDPFFTAAFRFFGLSDSAMPPPAERPDRLIALCRRERTLLILDGLEPIQDHAGRIRDPALRDVVRELAAQSPGLLVLTSRVAVDDLAPAEGTTARLVRLDRLPSPSGIALLRKLGVTVGTDEELDEAVTEFKGHALALTLLGTLLTRGHRGDIRAWKQLPGIVDERNRLGGQASRAMAAYDHWLGDRERAILRLLGLFDRPAPGGALAALRAKPAVRGLNRELVGLGNVVWRETISDLRTAGLVEQEDGGDPDAVDAHPLVRAYFGMRLKGDNEAAWVEGNRRLYVWYSRAAKERPDTAKEMEPLYAAVTHGCRAGLYQETLVEVYWQRILRGEEHFSWHKLGTFGAELSALAGFFEEPWIRPVTALEEADHSLALNEAGFVLRALGRLPEAVAPMRAGLEMDIAAEDWKQAAIQASNLSELHLVLGQLPEAIKTAWQSIELADRSGDAFWRMSTRTTLADALHQAGQPDDAARLFRDAEGMQKEDRPEFSHLFSLRGYQYCDLLLSRGESEEVLWRAEQTIEIAQLNNWLLDIALDHLSLSRAHLALHPSAPQSRTNFDEAVARLRESGYQDHLTHGLIHRAAFHRQLNELDAATRDLDEALRIATRGQMRLYEADARLERVRLLLALHKPNEARNELNLARKLIAQMGYKRREPEVLELAGQLPPSADDSR